MVVVLIIAVLLAIAIPTFLGARNRADDAAAKSSLRDGLTAAETIYADGQDYSKANADRLNEIEHSIRFTLGGFSSGYKNVAVAVGEKTWHAAALSKSGTCFLLNDETDATREDDP